MGSDDSIRAARRIFKNMTDDEAMDYLSAGDYTSVAGVPLPEDMSRRIAALASEHEVRGFVFGVTPLSPSPLPIPYPNTGSRPKRLDAASSKLYEAACKGTHIPDS